MSQAVVTHEFRAGHEQCNWTMRFRMHARQNTTGQSLRHVCIHTLHRLSSETMRSSRASICIYLLICTLSLCPFRERTLVTCIHQMHASIISFPVCRNDSVRPSFSRESLPGKRSVTAKDRRHFLLPLASYLLFYLWNLKQ